MSEDRARLAAHWRSGITRVAPGEISFRGYPVESLIGTTRLPATIWLLLRGELPTEAQAHLLEAALVASVDHGPQAPSIAIARMAVTTGLPLNGALASAVNTLDDVHGGAGEQAVQLFEAVLARMADGATPEAAADQAIAAWREAHGRHLPGFGHRFHPVDPRVGPLLALVADAVANGIVDGRYAAAGTAVEQSLARGRDRPVPMNIDGATAIVYAELGFSAPLARGLFCLARSVGILAHAWEESQAGERNKGPMPRDFGYSYEGPDERSPS